MHSELVPLGWSAFFADQLEPRGESVPARVAVDHGALLTVLCPDPVQVPAPREDRATTGDWVLIARRGGSLLVERRLERRTSLVRRAAGTRGETQVVAANLDVAFVVTAADGDFVPARLDRYVAAVRGGGVEPVVVLNKSDLDPGGIGRYLGRCPPGVDVVVASAAIGLGVDELRQRLGPGTTAAFVGSSGVGKSSLANALVGVDRQVTRAIREDGRGVHTTTRRDLLVLPGGGVLVDTPGMRELGLAEADLGGAFPDIEALARACRFRDCAHETEPDCAVLGAIDAGNLDPGRLRSWGKLQRELARAEARARGRRRR